MGRGLRRGGGRLPQALLEIGDHLLDLRAPAAGELQPGAEKVQDLVLPLHGERAVHELAGARESHLELARLPALLGAGFQRGEAARLRLAGRPRTEELDPMEDRLGLGP
jgi:hypothetical protein